MLHFLATATDDEFTPFRNLAKDYLSGDRVPGRQLKRRSLERIVKEKPRQLISRVVDELQSYHDPDADSLLGGGIAEAINLITHEGAHLLGLDVLKDKIFGAPKRKPIPLNSEIAAYLTDKTYLKPSERPLKTVGYTRLPEYDSSYVSVWKNDKSDELTVSVRGTKLSAKDLLFDAAIMFGKTDVKLKELDETLNRIETRYPGQKYNLASHSLGSAYVMTEIPDHQQNVDEYYFYNPASSPMQSNDVLDRFANLPNATYYVNNGDPVNDTMRQRMSRDTLQTAVYIGPYAYTPWKSHSIDQWYPDFLQGEKVDQEEVEKLMPDATMKQDTVSTQETKLS